MAPNLRQVQVAPSLHDALTLIVRGIKEALPIDACAVYLTDVENGQFVLMASDGLDAASVGQRRARFRSKTLTLLGPNAASASAQRRIGSRAGICYDSAARLL